MGKKGGTHVGVVLSFVIFVTFLVFIYSSLADPVISQSSKQSILNNLKLQLFGKIYVEDFIIFTITNNTPIPAHGAQKDCIKITSIIDDIPNENIDEEKLTIKNESDYILSYRFLGGDNHLRIGIINDLYSSGFFLKVYYSQDLNRASPDLPNTGCENFVGEDFVALGYIRKEIQIFESSIINLINNYTTNYEGLKDELGIPPDSDFWFSFEYANGTVIEMDKRIPSTDVYAGAIPVQYVDNEANILLGLINIKVW